MPPITILSKFYLQKILDYVSPIQQSQSQWVHLIALASGEINFSENWVVSSFAAEVFYFLCISDLSTGIKFILYLKANIFGTTHMAWLSLIERWRNNESGCITVCFCKSCDKSMLVSNSTRSGLEFSKHMREGKKLQNSLFCGFTPCYGQSVWFCMHHKCHGDKCS